MSTFRPMTIRLSSLFIVFLITLDSAFANDPISADHAMVVTEQHLATEVGLGILRNGGNAVDAAVAVGYALAVVHPCCGNLGGGGFMLIHKSNGQNIFLDFREKAPLAATATMFQDSNGHVIPKLSTDSYLAVAVPGTVLGLETARKKYGTLSRAALIEPAIQLARNGFVLEQGDIDLLSSHYHAFSRQANVAAIFLSHGQTYHTGDRLTQPQLAQTLGTIKKYGANGFYKGHIARTLAQTAQQHGGILAQTDFDHYTVEEQHPIECIYRGYRILSAPPPSSGGVTLCEILNTISAYPIAQLGPDSAQGIHYRVEAMRYAFMDRNNMLGDPDFVRNPVNQLLSAQHAAQIRSQILALQATPSASDPDAAQNPEGMHTTHYSIVDSAGNAVSVTYTINSFFGNHRIAGDTGFFLNDEMDDFAAKPGAANEFGLVQSSANAIAPGKRPLSSMSPTIVLKGHKIFMVTGSPGGPRIITTVLATLINVIDYHMNIQDAVNAPRIHEQWLPDTIYAEPGAVSTKIQQRLEQAGYKITDQPFTWGAAESILIDPHTGILYGANDSRRPAGLAAGY
ncbi:MAG: gamma-glutamyltransferase [Sulfuriferula sp.]